MSGGDYRYSQGRERSRSGLLLLAVALLGLGGLLIGFWYEHRGHDKPTGLSKLVVQLHDLPSGYEVFYAGRDAKMVVSRSSDGYGVAYQHEKGAVLELLRAPVLVISSITTFRTAAAAHSGMKEIARRNAGPQTTAFHSLRPPRVGNEAIFYEGRQRVSQFPLSGTFIALTWRSGRMVSVIATVGFGKAQRSETLRLARLEQTRIARTT